MARWLLVIDGPGATFVMCESVERLPSPDDPQMRLVRADEAGSDPRIAAALAAWRAGDDTLYRRAKSLSGRLGVNLAPSAQNRAARRQAKRRR